ncbi:MAG TPA: energy transducer TonB [Cyclobacteriaceae bacterium]|nr:energy transducer TonB [Cyclobacteriaceae bacterium]
MENRSIREEKMNSGNLISELHDVLEIKEKRVSVQSRNSSLFLSIGLCLSLLMVITAFEYKFYDSGDMISLGGADSKFEETMEVPPTEQPPPPPPKMVVTEIVEVSDEEEIVEDIPIDLDVEMTETQVVEQIVYQPEKVEDEETQQIFTIVEQQPEPDGGISAFYEYVGKNLKYPNLARRNNIEGRVFIQFVVERDGSLTDIKTLKGIGGGCDEEAERIIGMAPKWKPGKQRGRPVRVQMVLPILFKLEM